jgi:hypothetical protein
MKKTILTLSLFAVSISSIFAQYSDLSYSEKKSLYNYRNFQPQYGDPYIPALSGVASFFIPGLGQMICDETNRGLAFLGGYLGSTVLYVVGAIELTNSLSASEDPSFNRASTRGSGKMILGLIGMGISSIWSIVDAVQVAKVNNLYFRDQIKKASFDLELNPYIDQLSINNTVTNPIGLSLKATF